MHKITIVLLNFIVSPVQKNDRGNHTRGVFESASFKKINQLSSRRPVKRARVLRVPGVPDTRAGFSRGGVGVGPRGGYRPGGSLTDQTGRIPDTANEGRRELERAHAMEIEQCYGRETTVYFRV